MQVKQANVSGFTLTESIHPGGEDLPWHSHEGTTICYVLRGGFKERSRGQALLCTPSTLKFMPAGETHCNEFHAGEVRGLVIEVDPARLGELGSLAPLLDEKLHFEGGPETPDNEIERMVDVVKSKIERLLQYGLDHREGVFK